MRILPVIAIAASATVASAAIAGPVQDRYGPPRQAGSTAHAPAAPVYGRSLLTWPGRAGAPDGQAARVPDLTRDQPLDHAGEHRPEPARVTAPTPQSPQARPLPLSQPHGAQGMDVQGMGGPSHASPAVQPRQEAGGSAAPSALAQPAPVRKAPASQAVRHDAAAPWASHGPQQPSPAAGALEAGAPGRTPAGAVVAAPASPARPAPVQAQAPTPPATPAAPSVAALPTQKSSGPGQGAVRIYSLHREYGMTPDPAPRPSPGGYVLVGPSEAPGVGAAHMSGGDSTPQPF